MFYKFNVARSIEDLVRVSPLIQNFMVKIRVIKPDASVGKGGRSFIQASKAWVIVSPNTNAKCAFSACVVHQQG